MSIWERLADATSNFDFNIGPSDGFRNTNNIQPVIPFSLNEDWNLISRTIVPVIYQHNTAGDSGDQFGLSDTLQSLFFSTAAPKPTALGNLIWGAGPAIEIPTSTDCLLGGGHFGMGPTGVILFQAGGVDLWRACQSSLGYRRRARRPAGTEWDLRSTLRFLHNAIGLDILH